MQVQSLGREVLWSRKWKATKVFLPGKPPGQRSMVGYSAWDSKESDTTKHAVCTHIMCCQS